MLIIFIIAKYNNNNNTNSNINNFTTNLSINFRIL